MRECESEHVRREEGEGEGGGGYLSVRTWERRGGRATEGRGVRV